MTVPFMPFYIADYMADTSHLTTVEHGAYLMLIMNYWQRGQSLPNDDRKLARIVGLGPREWKRMRDTISEFFEISGSEWRHTRVESELASLRAKSLKKRNGGLARAKQMHSKCSADAQLLIDTDTEAEVPSTKVEGAAPDADKIFWENAKAYLSPHSKDPGKLIGKWIKDCGGDKAAVARATGEAQINRVVDPVSYISRLIHREKEGAGAKPDVFWG